MVNESEMGSLRFDEGDCSEVIQAIRNSVLTSKYSDFWNRKVIHTQDPDFYPDWHPFETVVENVPVSKIFGMQNSIEEEDSTFLENLFCFLNGKGRITGKPWTNNVYDYFESSQNSSEYIYTGCDLEKFGLPGGKRQLTMARYGDKYYCLNGKHRMVAGMFYLYCKNPDDAHFKDVIVEVFKEKS